MKWKYSFLVLVNLSLYVLIGCKSISIPMYSEPMYSEKQSTLLAGRVVFAGEDDGDDVNIYGVSFAGITTSDITILLRNTATNEVLRLSPPENGLFYVYLPEGEYWMDKLSLVKKERNGAWAYISTKPALKVFKVERGKVNNIGTIQWLYADGRHFVIQEDNSSKIQTVFSEQFPKSNWNQKEWKYEPLSFDEKKPSEPVYNETNPTLLVGKL